jgi:hypothetical protein
MHAMTNLIMIICFKRLGGSFECFNRHKNYVVEVSPHFKLEQLRAGVLSVPKNKILKDYVRSSAETVPRKMRFHVDINFLFLFVWIITPEVCTSIVLVDTTCVMKKATICNAKNVIE